MEKSAKTKTIKTLQSESPFGWSYSATEKTHYEVGLDNRNAHSGTRCAYIKSIVNKPKPFGNLMQNYSPDEYLGKRLKMTAWVKTDLVEGSCQLWLRIDQEPKTRSWHGTFDNMADRPILRRTEWTQYELVVDVPENSSNIAFGCMLIGNGKVWLDDVAFNVVNKKTPLTGNYATKKLKPLNLDFERSNASSSKTKN